MSDKTFGQPDQSDRSDRSDRFDRVVARANPIDDETVAGLPLSAAETDLLEEIVKTPAPVLDDKPRRPLVVMLAAAAVAAVLTAGLVAVPRLVRSADPAGSGPTSGVVGTTSAKPAKPAATVPPRRFRAAAPAAHQVLLDVPGWRVYHVYEQGAPGEVYFRKDNGPMFWVEWRPANMYTSTSQGSVGRRTTQALGRPATEFDFGTYLSTMSRPSGATFLDIRGDSIPADQYRFLVSRLTWVDKATWEAALPASSLLPSQQPAAIAAMLADIPKPDGFDPATLRTAQSIDRYNLGADVAGAVTCRWIEDWDKARRAGDAEQTARALDALKSSRHWKILLEMQRTGDFTRILWDYVDQVAAGTLPKDYRMGLCS